MASSQTPNEINTDQKPDTSSLPTDPDDVLKRVNDCRKKADEKLNDWFDEAKIDFNFYEGAQYPDEDVEKMEKENRIPVIFNRVAAVVNAICGQEVNNRQEVKYLPRRATNYGPPGPPNPQTGQPSPPQPIPSPADPMNDAVKWAREQCNAEDEDSDAFRDMVICGMGWSVLRMDYEENPEGMTEVIRIDPLRMRWDPSARRKNVVDKAWVQCDHPMNKEDGKARWPKTWPDVTTTATGASPKDRANPIDTTENWKYQDSSASGSQAKRDEVRVIHHIERRKVPKFRAVDPASGSMKEYTQAEADNAQKNHATLPPEVQQAQPLPEFVPVMGRAYWEAWTVGGTVLQSGLAPSQKDFCYQAMTCYRERETGYWIGAVRHIRDPQRYANRLMSLMMSILGTGAKGGVLYETGAFVNPKKAKDDWARWDSAIELSPGSLAAGKVQAKPPVQLPPGAADLMQFSIGSIRDVAGVNIELLGQENSNETGVVEDMKTKAGLTILASMFDAMRLYRKRQGVILAEYIQKFISDGRLIRIIGSPNQQFIPLLRDPESVEYDIVVDESPSSRDVKERTWGALQLLVPMAMQTGMPLPPNLLDYSPLPQSLVMEWKQAIEAQKGQPPPDPLPVQVEKLKMAGDQQKMQQQGQLDMQAKQQDVQIEQQKIQMDAAAKQQEQQSALALQASNDERDAARSQQQHERDMQKMALDNKFKYDQMQAKFQFDAAQKELDRQSQERLAQHAAQTQHAQFQQTQATEQTRFQADQGAKDQQGQARHGELMQLLQKPKKVTRSPDGSFIVSHA